MSRRIISETSSAPSEAPPSEAPLSEAPLSEATFLILASLGSGPKHGYAIMKAVDELSRGRVQLSTGTLYGAIKRLLADGWIQRVEQAEDSPALPANASAPPASANAGLDAEAGESAGGRQEFSGGRERKSYCLTRRGQSVLHAETQRMSELVDIARLQLRGANA